MSNLHVNLAATVKAAASKTIGAVLSVHPQGTSFFDVVAKIASRPDTATPAQAVASLLKDKFAVVAGTLMEYEEGFVRATVAPHRESQPFTEESTKTLSMVTANVFMDPQDNAWHVEGDRLVKSVDTDFAALAESLKSTSVPRGSPILATAQSIVASATHTPFGAYVYFLTASGETDFGILVQQASASGSKCTTTASGQSVNVSPLSVKVVSRHSRRLLAIPANAILESVEVAGTAMPQVNFDVAPVLDYYGQLFGKGTEFYKTLESTIKQNFS